MGKWRHLTLFSLIAVIASCGANETNSVAEAKIRVADQMKDPSSVQFRKVAVGSNGCVAGEVNAKNSFGAYQGFEMFVVDSGGVILSPSTDEQLDRYLSCRHKNYRGPSAGKGVDEAAIEAEKAAILADRAARTLP